MDPAPSSLAGYTVFLGIWSLFFPENFGLEVNRNAGPPELSSFSLHPSSTEPQVDPQQAQFWLGREANGGIKSSAPILGSSGGLLLSSSLLTK